MSELFAIFAICGMLMCLDVILAPLLKRKRRLSRPDYYRIAVLESELNTGERWRVEEELARRERDQAEAESQARREEAAGHKPALLPKGYDSIYDMNRMAAIIANETFQGRMNQARAQLDELGIALAQATPLTHIADVERMQMLARLENDIRDSRMLGQNIHILITRHAIRTMLDLTRDYEGTLLGYPYSVVENANGADWIIAFDGKRWEVPNPGPDHITYR